MLYYASVVLTLFVVVVQSSHDCMYVSNPSWTNPTNWWSEGKSGIIPIGYCESDIDEDDGAESNYFMCTSWGQVYVVHFSSIGCSDNPQYITHMMGHTCCNQV